MDIPPIHPSEYRFCLILWELEPIRSGELVKVCSQRLGWSKSTTFTVIRNLSDRGAVQNQDGIVTVRFTKEQVQTSRIEQEIETYFDGSPARMIEILTKSGRRTSGDGKQT